jgi:hypothetical protein
LTDQVAELQRQLNVLPQHPRYHVLAVPDGPLGFRMRTNGPSEARALDETNASMEGTITLLRSKNPLPVVREIIREYSAAPPLPDWDDFDELFDLDMPF